MTQICTHQFCGPIPWNTPYAAWRIIHTVSREDISPFVVYANDETGDLWRFVRGTDGNIVRDRQGKPEIERLSLGPGAFRMERAW